MQYSVRLKNSISGLFLVDFSDAIDHQHYTIHKNGTMEIYSKDQMKKEINLNDLYDYSLQVKSMFNAMLDWADNTEEPKTKTILDDTVDSLIHQVKTLDEKLDRLS